MHIADALRIGPGEVVTLVGGGGKTTVMFRLADELTAAGLRVISTMTTKIFVGQMERAPASLLLRDDGTLPPELAAKVAIHRHVLIGGRITTDREKVEGVPPEIVDQIVAAHLADVVIVEADGSRRLPMKAPAEHEPVVPASTTLLVPLVGLDVLGQPLDAEHVHRPQLISALAGVALNEQVTPRTVAQVLAHRSGGAKGLPPSARLVPFLNKADLQLAGGRETARLLLETEIIDEVVIGAAETPEPAREAWGRTAAILLAAGEAKRFGQLKQVMPWRGKPLVAHVAQQALACPDLDQVVVTTGAQAELVEAALAPYAEEIERIRVEDWTEGQSRSVRAGLGAALGAAPKRECGPSAEMSRCSISAAVFLLADQPGITPELLSALIQRHRETRAPVVAPRYQGQRGNPVLFDRVTFPGFEHLEGDTGARSIIRRYDHTSEDRAFGEHGPREYTTAWVDWPTDEILRDIDTPEDYAAASRAG